MPRTVFRRPKNSRVELHACKSSTPGDKPCGQTGSGSRRRARASPWAWAPAATAVSSGGPSWARWRRGFPGRKVRVRPTARPPAGGAKALERVAGPDARLSTGIHRAGCRDGISPPIVRKVIHSWGHNAFVDVGIGPLGGPFPAERRVAIGGYPGVSPGNQRMRGRAGRQRFSVGRGVGFVESQSCKFSTLWTSAVENAPTGCAPRISRPVRPQVLTACGRLGLQWMRGARGRRQ